MRKLRTTTFLLLCALPLAACGTAPIDRTLSGAALGAGTGAAVGALVSGIAVGPALLVGALAGGATGALTEPAQIDLGDPVWR